MTSFLFIALFSLLATGLGWSVVARCDHGGALTAPERLAAAFVVGTLAFYFAVFAVGPFALNKSSMGIVALAAAALAIPGLRTMPWAAMRTGFSRVVCECRRPWVAALWLAVLGIGTSSLLQGLAPPNDYDSLMYHLTIPQYDVENGRITPAWNYSLPNAFFPAGMHHLYRLALVFANGGAAQMVHGLFGIAAAVATAALARRMGAGPYVALLAAGMFLAVRAVIWEMATAEVDVASATWFALVMVVYLAWRDRAANTGGDGLLVLLGMTIGGGILTKYHGGVAALAIGAVLLVDVARGRMRPSRIVLAPAVALALFTPHLIRAYILTGNPIFPLFNAQIVPGNTTTLDDAHLLYGTGRGLLDLLTTPISMSIAPMHFYDGMILGAPYLLAFAPLALFDRARLISAAPVFLATSIFYIFWFYRMGHQVRFLMSLFPFVAAFAAIGAAAAWRRARPFLWARVAFIGLAGALTLNQFMFIGAYTALRLPVALGVQPPEAYHRTPTMDGAFYAPCMYVRTHLAPGEKYLSLIGPHSYYCPQASAHLNVWPGEERAWLRAEQNRHRITPAEFLEFFEKNSFRFVIVKLVTESRRNNTGESILTENPMNELRFGPFLEPAFRTLKPLFRGKYAAVYDGREVLAELKKSGTR